MTKQHTIFSLLCGCLLGLAACSSDPANLQEFETWFNNPEHGFVKTKQIEKIIFRVQYRPAELMMLNELEPNQSYTPKAIDSLRQSYGNSHYFLLEVGYDDEAVNGDLLRTLVPDYPTYSQKVKELSFQLESNVRMIAGSDTVAPTLYHYERGYELGKRQRFLFAFPDVAGGSALTFHFLDPIFNAGILNFRFEQSMLDQKPPLPVTIK